MQKFEIKFIMSMTYILRMSLFRGYEKVDATAKLGILNGDTNIPFPYRNFKKHINDLSKRKRQSKWHVEVNNKSRSISWVCGMGL